MGKNQLAIRLLQPKTVYFGGDVIHGAIDLFIRKSINIRDITLDLIAVEDVHRSEGGFHTKHEFVREGVVLTGPATGEQSLKPNNYSWTFACQLGNRLPTSCRFSEGSITYYLQCNINVKFGKDLRNKLEFFVGGDLYDNAQFIRPTPFIQSNNKDFVLGSGDMTLRVTASKKCAFLGDQIQFFIDIENHSSKRVQSVTVQLFQKTCFGKNGVDSTLQTIKRKVSYAAEKLDFTVEPKTNGNFTAMIRLPSDVVPTIETFVATALKNITCIYFYRITAQIPLATDLRVDIPMTLKRLNPMADVEGAASVQAAPPGNYATLRQPLNLPPVNNTSQYPLAPPGAAPLPPYAFPPPQQAGPPQPQQQYYHPPPQGQGYAPFPPAPPQQASAPYPPPPPSSYPYPAQQAYPPPPLPSAGNDNTNRPPPFAPGYYQEPPPPNSIPSHPYAHGHTVSASSLPQVSRNSLPASAYGAQANNRSATLGARHVSPPPRNDYPGNGRVSQSQPIERPYAVPPQQQYNTLRPAHSLTPISSSSPASYASSPSSSTSSISYNAPYYTPPPATAPEYAPAPPPSYNNAPYPPYPATTAAGSSFSSTSSAPSINATYRRQSPPPPPPPDDECHEIDAPPPYEDRHYYSAV